MDALLGKPGQLIGAQELKKWREGPAKIAPATINQISNAVCAALKLGL
jgi:hypothetical protein